MKATVKPEYVGQTSSKYGLLVEKQIYEVNKLGKIFNAVKEIKLPQAVEKPPVDKSNGGNENG